MSAVIKHITFAWYRRKCRQTFLLLLGLCLGSCLGDVSGVAAMRLPYVTADMEQAQYWVNRLEQPDQLILDRQAIDAFNAETRRHLPDKEFDLREYPETLTKGEVIRSIREYEVPQNSRYVNGVLLGADYFQRLERQLNLAALTEAVPVRYAITCVRSSIRSFSTADFVASSPGDGEFDLFQETALDPAEPVAILHQSADARWYFVQAYNYRGWVAAEQVALAASRQEWLSFLPSRDFLVVTGSRLDVAGRHFAMGAKLVLVDATGDAAIQKAMPPAAGYTVKIPGRGPQGELLALRATVTGQADVSRGPLPYTRANILRQAFKMLAEPYGWGGLFGVRDCSALTLDVYRSFGLLLPRNADEQEQAAGGEYRLNGSGRRIDLMRQLQPGATLHMPGHVMLFLGSVNGRYYAIHALGARGGTGEVPGPVMRVVVSDLSLTLKSSGKAFLDALTVAKQPE